jgi:hypothetical protein
MEGTTMSALPQLGLPILVSSALIFVASSLIHMLLKWHNSDYRKLSNEDQVRAAIRAVSAEPGLYVLPHCAEMKDMQSPEMTQKFIEGPVGFVTLRRSGPPAIGASLLQWFVFTLIIAAAAAALAVQAFGIDGDRHQAAHLIGMISLLVYAGASVPEGIWMGRTWRSVFKHGVDGAIYATISALTFMWLWP